MGGQLVRMVVQVLAVVILARLLDPRDFGLLAMVLSVVAVAEIFRDMGLSTAAIQAKVLTPEQRDNLFWLNSCIGSGLALLAFVAAPLVADVFHEPVLVPMTKVLALMFLFNGMATQYRADLTRRMLFGRLVVADTAAPVVGLLVATALAVAGAGHWALVAQLLTQYLTVLVLVVVGAGWLPGRPRRDVPMGDFLKFGWTIVGSQLIGYVANNTDSVIIGSRLGAGPLGLYNRAFQLVMSPLGQLRGSTGTVGVSLLARVQDDPGRSQRYVERGQLALGCTVVAGLGLIIGGAEPIVDVMLGPKWDVATILSLLALAGAFQTLSLVGYWVYVSQGLTRDLMHYSVVSAVIKVLCVVAGSRWGVVGVAVGYAIAPALSWPISFWWLSRHANVRVAPLYSGAGRIALITSVTAMGAWAGASISDDSVPAVLSLLASIGCGLSGYALLVACVRPIRADAMMVFAATRTAMRRR
ncbi:polysaccharide transporter, PST family [Nocardioides terrae]|uniref:Polysaccharide transporter, PST family n=2 Tax=Nocardioides terrae TaxID=574651 RepID=A0A1I1I0G1_9ACTN|nr:polysaccharide transporter, PST family [Nocardioides terrae]